MKYELIRQQRNKPNTYIYIYIYIYIYRCISMNTLLEYR